MLGGSDLVVGGRRAECPQLAGSGRSAFSIELRKTDVSRAVRLAPLHPRGSIPEGSTRAYEPACVRRCSHYIGHIGVGAMLLGASGPGNLA
jgi:hypothetical protein